MWAVSVLYNAAKSLILSHFRAFRLSHIGAGVSRKHLENNAKMAARSKTDANASKLRHPFPIQANARSSNGGADKKRHPR